MKLTVLLAVLVAAAGCTAANDGRDSLRADSPAAAAAAAAACPTDWHEHAGTCYWWSGGYVLAYGGDNLVGVCSQVHASAEPVSSHDHATDAFLLSLVWTAQTWLGLRQHAVNRDDWFWEDGSPVDYTNWGQNEPWKGDHCAYLGKLGDGSGVWESLNCDRYVSYFCQLQP